MTTSPSLTMMMDTAQSTSTLMINQFDLIVSDDNLFHYRNYCNSNSVINYSVTSNGYNY